MTNEELKKWIEFGSDETDTVCPCCGGTGQKKGNTGDGYVPQYYDDIVGCM